MTKDKKDQWVLCPVCNKKNWMTKRQFYKIRQGRSTGRHIKCARKEMGNYITNKRIVFK